MEERKGERKETNKKKKIMKNQERKHEKQTKNKTESAQDNQRNGLTKKKKKNLRKENKNKANCSLTSDYLPFLYLFLFSAWYFQPSLGGKALTIKLQK